MQFFCYGNERESVLRNCKNSKSTTDRKLVKKMSEVKLSQRCLRSHNTRTVLASKENKMGNPKWTPKSGNVRRALSHSSHNTDSSTDSQSPVLSSAKITQVFGEMKNSKKIINAGRRSTRAALKVYDYCEADPDAENRPEGISKKKSQMEVRSTSKVERVIETKHKKSVQMNSTIPLKRKSIIDSSYFLCDKKTSHGIKRQNSAKLLKTEPKLRQTSVLANMSGTTTKISVKSDVSTCATTEKVNRKCPSSSANSISDSNTELSSDCLSKSKNLSLTDLPYQACSTPILRRKLVATLGISPIVAKDVAPCFIPSGQYDSINKICEDVSEAFTNVSSVHRHQGDVNCTMESEELHEEVDYEEVDDEPLHLELTSTPEKSPSSAVSHEYHSCVDSGMDEIVVTLYDSPKKLSPIKKVDPPDSSLSDDSCYWDDDFESPPQKAGDKTPVKNDVEETVMKSFKAYHTPHQFRRHLFKKKSKKTLQKPKPKSPAEVKLDTWASFMNDHFEDIEGSELVIE